ncbi:MAG: NimC/NimA family protein, partial [Treponema sp.]|nr:NimC/NimA family protein [Treponema sp.]
ANPKIEISAMDKPDRWIRVTAEAVEDDRVAVKKHMLDAYPDLKGMYNENDPNTLVLYLKNAVATIEAFGAEKKVIKF